MADYKLAFFLTGRLTQDSVENLFSQARGQGVVHPSCTTFRQALRLVTIAQYLQVNRGSSYEDDGTTYLCDYLEEAGAELTSDKGECLLPALMNASSDMESQSTTPPEDQCVLKDTGNDEPVIGEVVEEVSTVSLSEFMSRKNTSAQPLGSLETNALYDVVGWSVSKFLETENCEICKNALVQCDVTERDDMGLYTEVRSRGGLTHPSHQLVQAAKIAESVFSSNKKQFHRMPDIEKEVTGQVMDVLDTMEFDFPDCHRALYKVMRRFVRLRINEYANAATAMQLPKKQYGSKTACRTTIIF
jgi:hypothetical protein